MKILVIGAGGFVGSYIVPLLSKKHEVIPIYKNEIDLLDNQTVTKILDVLRPDVVINCLTFGGKTELHENNAWNVGKNMAVFYNFYTNEDKFKFYITFKIRLFFCLFTNGKNQSTFIKFTEYMSMGLFEIFIKHE